MLDPVRRNGRMTDINYDLDDRWYENELQPVEEETYRVQVIERKIEPRTRRPMFPKNGPIPTRATL